MRVRRVWCAAVRYGRAPALTLGALLASVMPARPGMAPGGGAADRLAGRPLAFEETAPVAGGSVRFLARARGGSVLLAADEMWIDPSGPAASLRVRFAGAGAHATAIALDPVATRTSYFLGNEPARWRRDVATFARVAVDGLWPGIRLIHHARGRELEQDFVVAAGADPASIRLAFDSDRLPHIDRSGDLVLASLGGGGRGGCCASEVRFHQPVAWQETGCGPRPVTARFEPRARGEIGFALGDYDRRLALVIDPVLAFSSYLGGNGMDGDRLTAMTIDGKGNVYVTGFTDSIDFPVVAPLQPQPNGIYDVFVTKFQPGVSVPVFSTYLGGNTTDKAHAIAVDAAGAVYLTGETYSTDFPVQNAVQATSGFTADAFVTKIAPDGTDLEYSTYLHEIQLVIQFNWDDAGTAIAVDPDGFAYVAGSTQSFDLPVVNALQPRSAGFSDVFVGKLDRDGGRWIWLTFLGGTGSESASGIGIASGEVYVAGDSGSLDFPVTPGAFETALGGGLGTKRDAFVTVINTDGTSIVRSTYLGGSDEERCLGLVVDGAGAPYLVGLTQSVDFPTVAALQGMLRGASDAFVARLSPDLGSLGYATYLGGGDRDSGGGIAIDGAGQVYLSGNTSSADFPVVSPVQATLDGATDAFVAKLDARGTALVWSTLLGGSDREERTVIGVGPDRAAWVAGETRSRDFPLRAEFQGTYGGGSSDAFVARIDCPMAVAVGNTLLAVKVLPGDLTISWSDRPGIAPYRLREDTIKSGPFLIITAETPSGAPGITVVQPAAALVHYRVAGLDACGEGAL